MANLSMANVAVPDHLYELAEDKDSTLGQGVDFIAHLEQEGVINQREKAILRATQIASPEELFSLMQSFPSLAAHGVDRARLSSIGASESASSFMRVARQAQAASSPSKRRKFGACYPAKARAPKGFKVPLPDDAAADAVANSALQQYNQSLNFLIPTDWDARDQGDRGTCVAFAVVACREYLDFLQRGEYSRLSEQFLYWGAKRTDRNLNAAGTHLRYAARALSRFGVCENTYWPYSEQVVEGNETHEGDNAPSENAKEDARSRLFTDKRAVKGHASGNAERLLQALQAAKRPIPISVPVFKDEADDSDNWTTAISYLSGKVIDPPPTSEVVGGHAVCVTGWIPTANEQLGGYFVFRNSWGTEWASAPPNRPPGYGQISATYIERYLWEMYVD